MLISAFADEFSEDTETDESRPASVIMEADFLHDDWLQELPEDLDVCIAQRDFEGAVDLISKGRSESIVSELKFEKFMTFFCMQRHRKVFMPKPELNSSC